jgi:methylated-DNA-[protein]-cysteine S-methyltransferase
MKTNGVSDQMTEKIYFTTVNTAFGEMTILWRRTNDLKIQRILLPSQKDVLHTTYPLAINSTSEEISEFAENLVYFLEGEDRRFNLDRLDLDLCSEFQRRVIIAEYGIPRGFVSTYGRIARYLGHPQSSRAVGRALATNLFPLAIPCHRAVRSSGELGGYQGGLGMKKSLLEMEGIQFISDYKVEMNKVYY